MSSAVYLVRHGMAEETSATVPDEERHLTSEGREILQRAAVGLRHLGITPEAILTSPLVRAVETARILARPVAPDVGIQPCPALAPGSPLAAIFNLLADYQGAGEILLVGHEPTMGELASCLLSGSPGIAKLRFKPGAVAAINLPALPPEAPGSLQWFLRAEHLAEIGPP